MFVLSLSEIGQIFGTVKVSDFQGAISILLLGPWAARIQFRTECCGKGAKFVLCTFPLWNQIALELDKKRPLSHYFRCSQEQRKLPVDKFNLHCFLLSKLFKKMSVEVRPPLW
jgi:hypothetical protein